jgi:hypothetical protein
MTMRMNLDMGVMAIELEGNEPVATARFDGERMEMRMDIGVMFEEMAESEPMFASALDMMGDIDLSQAVGIDPSALSSLSGATTADPAAMLDLIHSVGSDVVEAGKDNIGGVETTRFVTRVGLGDLLASQNGYADLLGTVPGSSLRALLDLWVDYIINIDGAGMDIRVTMNFFDHNQVGTIAIPSDALDVSGVFTG